MKKFIQLVAVVLMLTTFSVSAKSVNSLDEDLPSAAKAMSEIIKLKLDELEIDREVAMDVFFTINSDNEVAVLNVKTTDTDIKQYIKQSLNTLKIEDAKLVVGKVYSINVKIKTLN